MTMIYYLDYLIMNLVKLLLPLYKLHLKVKSNINNILVSQWMQLSMNLKLCKRVHNLTLMITMKINNKVNLNAI